MIIYPSFSEAIKATELKMRDYSYLVRPARWQSTDVSTRPEAVMRELLNISFSVPIPPTVEQLRGEIKPNLNWVDEAFIERVEGIPWNPGKAWNRWPWANSANEHRDSDGKFSHTYAERYWPKIASDHVEDLAFENKWSMVKDLNTGIRFPYGDLEDVVLHLARDPMTRQAFLPVWFPEDTGVVHEQRVPCSLGYHLIMRNGFFHHSYYIRSCDIYRHFRDDLYLSARLHLWVLERLRTIDPEWNNISVGLFTFHCVSLHCFVNDFKELFNGES